MKTKIVAAIGGIVMLVSMSACGADAESGGNADTTDVEVHQKIGISGDSDINMWKVNIGGTECVVIDGYESAGLSCNWNEVTP